MSEVNTNVIKMLAVHDERIEYGQRTDDLIIKMLDDVFEHRIIHTGQNSDSNLCEIFFKDLIIAIFF
jgi:UDP-N-acetylglucosamine 2-epimerase